jgi:hypothetical protein
MKKVHMNMNVKKPLLLFSVTVIVLLGLAILLQYLVNREVIVGLPSEQGHAHAHGEDEQGNQQEGESPQDGQTDLEISPGVNLISNYGFEVGTREQIWGWARIGQEQGVVVYRDDDISRRGLASAAVDTNGASVIDAGLIMRLDELPRARDVIFEGYIKTDDLAGEAYLKILAEGKAEGDEKIRPVVIASTDEVNGDSDWTPTRIRCYVPPETTGVWLEAGVYGKGRAWFDDLSLSVEEREDALASGENLLRNPTFEEGTRHWHLFSETINPVLEYGAIPMGPHGGMALYLQDRTPDPSVAKYSGFHQAICGLYGHKGTLAVSGWLRADNAGGNGYVGVGVFKAGGEQLLRNPVQVSGNLPWSDFSMSIPIDGEVASVWVMINLEGSGRLYVSDLKATFQEQ